MASLYYSLPASAGLGQGLPKVKPSTPEPLPGRLKELPGKLGWMKWEPMSLTAQVRGGGHTANEREDRTAKDDGVRCVASSLH